MSAPPSDHDLPRHHSAVQHPDDSPEGARHDVSAVSSSQASSLLDPDMSLVDPDMSMSSIGDEKHPKGRRKRTTAEDKTILEDAYRTNTKPDKAARRDIVERVTLNEKEVQIWFQNRRQNDRRKSRPLTAEEIESLRYGSLPAASSDPVASSQEGHAYLHSTSPHADHTTQTPAHRSTPSPHLPGSGSLPAPRSAPSLSRASSAPDNFGTPAPSHVRSGSVHVFGQTQQSPAIFSANRHSFASSWSTPSMVASAPGDSFCFDPSPAGSQQDGHTIPCLGRSQSGVRLSLSLEGKAQVISTETSSPETDSPAHLPAMSLSKSRPETLHRSQSDTSDGPLPPVSSILSAPRLARNRSRRVEEWESCAQENPCDELTKQAEHESNGSAIAAINLLRSTSSVLQMNSSKRNAPTVSKGSSTNSRLAKKARLSRVHSSVARIETGQVDAGDADKQKVVKEKMGVSALLSPTDSDKENVSPDGRGIGRRPLPAVPAKGQTQRRGANRILQESDRGMSPSLQRANTAPVKLKPWDGKQQRRQQHKGLSIFEDADQGEGEDNNNEGSTTAEEEKQQQEEVSAELISQDLSPSKKGDMYCAVGLLSLRKGAWR